MHTRLLFIVLYFAKKIRNSSSNQFLLRLDMNQYNLTLYTAHNNSCPYRFNRITLYRNSSSNQFLLRLDMNQYNLNLYTAHNNSSPYRFNRITLYRNSSSNQFLLRLDMNQYNLNIYTAHNSFQHQILTNKHPHLLIKPVSLQAVLPYNLCGHL